jgi:hypothetical protein
MPTIVCSVATLAVAAIFYTWRAYHDTVSRKHKTLRERVAYMLWMAAQAVPS